MYRVLFPICFVLVILSVLSECMWLIYSYSSKFAHWQWGNCIIVSMPVKWRSEKSVCHYAAVIMTKMASQITSLTVVYSTVYSEADQIKHQSSASLAFVWGIHRDRWIPRTKGQLRGKCFHLMTSSCNTTQQNTLKCEAFVSIRIVHDRTQLQLYAILTYFNTFDIPNVKITFKYHRMLPNESLKKAFIQTCLFTG